METHKITTIGSIGLTFAGLFLLFSSLLQAKPKQPTQQDICSGQEAVAIDHCQYTAGHSLAYCMKLGQRVYDECMAGKTAVTAAPTATPKIGASVHPTNGATTVKGGTGTASPSRPGAGSTGVNTVKEATPTPTPRKKH
jgi:hypothetical protein